VEREGKGAYRCDVPSNYRKIEHPLNMNEYVVKRELSKMAKYKSFRVDGKDGYGALRTNSIERKRGSKLILKFFSGGEMMAWSWRPVWSSGRSIEFGLNPRKFSFTRKSIPRGRIAVIGAEPVKTNSPADYDWDSN